MVVVFPLGKLIYLGIKQISKPISRRLQAGAKSSPFVRKYICMPPAQSKGVAILILKCMTVYMCQNHCMQQFCCKTVAVFIKHIQTLLSTSLLQFHVSHAVIHKLEVFVKMRWMGTTGPTHAKPLSDERAAELGAEIIGDTFVYAVAASLIIFEYHRSVRKEQAAEETQNSEIARLSESVGRLENELQNIRNSIENLSSKSNTTETKS